MRSVIYQFKEDELALIRILSPNDDYFYQSIVNYINDEAADAILVDKLKMFYQIFKVTNNIVKIIGVSVN